MSTPFLKQVTFGKGRIVWGAPSKTKDKDKAGKPLTTKSGAPRIKCDFGVAIPKNGSTLFWQLPWGADIYQVGLSAFPHLFDPTTKALLPGRKFSWKVTDGDSTIPNENGRKPCEQEGYPGCWVVAFGSSFVPRCVRYENGAWMDIDPAQIKTGHEVEIAGSVDSNGDAQKSGVYVNHGLVAHAGILPEIVSQGVDPTAAGFTAGFNGAIPTAGAAAHPGPGVLPQPGTAPAITLPQALPSPTPQPTAALPAPVSVTPQPGFLPVGTAPAPMPAPVFVPPAAPTGPVMTAKANGALWTSFAANGWTEADARTQGYIV